MRIYTISPKKLSQKRELEQFLFLYSDAVAYAISNTTTDILGTINWKVDARGTTVYYSGVDTTRTT